MAVFLGVRAWRAAGAWRRRQVELEGKKMRGEDEKGRVFVVGLGRVGREGGEVLGHGPAGLVSSLDPGQAVGLGQEDTHVAQHGGVAVQAGHHVSGEAWRRRAINKPPTLGQFSIHRHGSLTEGTVRTCLGQGCIFIPTMEYSTHASMVISSFFCTPLF